jgi:hypothetical protein
MPAAVSRRRRAPGTTCTACRPPRPRPTTPGCGTTSCTARRRRSGRSCHWRAIGPSDNGDGYVSAAREAAFAGPGKFWGVMRKAPKGRPARPDRRGHQPAHRQGAGTGRTSLSRDQAPVRLPEDALPRAGEEPGAALHALRPRQPVPDATATCGMRRSPSEIGPAAGQAVKTARKSLQTSRPMPKTARRTEHRQGDSLVQMFPIFSMHRVFQTQSSLFVKRRNQ